VFGILSDSKRYKFARLASGNQFELEPISLAGKRKIGKKSENLEIEISRFSRCHDVWQFALPSQIDV